MARPTRCVAVVDPDGRLALPRDVTGELAFQPGDRVELVIGRFPDASREYWQQVTEFEFPPEFQDELSGLLRENAAGTITPAALERLDTMIRQVEWQTTQRAH